MKQLNTYTHSFVDYYGLTRFIYANWIHEYNYIKDKETTEYVYKFPTSLDSYNKITKSYNGYLNILADKRILVDDIIMIEVEYTEKQKWYAEMMYDGALLPQEDN